MSQTNLTIRIDEDIKHDAETLFTGIGLNLSSAINVFFRQAIREQSMPFELKPYDDYKSKVKNSMIQADEGKLVKFTLEELESLEDMDGAKAIEFLETRRTESGL